MPSTRGWSVMSGSLCRALHHDRVRPVAVVAPAPRDLGEPLGRVERDRRPRCAALTSSSIRPPVADRGQQPRARARRRRYVAATAIRCRSTTSAGQRHHVADDLGVRRDDGRPTLAGQLLAPPTRPTRRPAPNSSASRAASAPGRRRPSPGAGSRDAAWACPGRRDVRAAEVERLRVEQLGALVGHHPREHAGVRVLRADRVRERTRGRAARPPPRPAASVATSAGFDDVRAVETQALPRRTTPSRPPCGGRPSRPGTARPRRPRRRPAPRARRACTRRTPGRPARAPACAR